MADLDYREYLDRSAEQLLALPQNVLSLLSGWPYRQLGPEMFEIVRSGQQEFDLPAHEIYDDLVAAYVRQKTFSKSVTLWLKQALGYWKYRLWLTFTNILVFPWIWRRMEGPTPEAPRDKTVAEANSQGSPKASIVVVSFNRLEYLRTTLYAFWETVGDASHELIVVDNGSCDGSPEFLRAAYESGWISKLLLLPENQGNAAGYNHGFALADPNSEYLMKLDSDVKVLSRDWLQKAVDFLDSHPKVGLVSLNLINHGCLRMLRVRTLDDHEVMDFGDWTVGSAMIVPRRVFNELGHFVERAGMTYVLEDVDYYVRVARKGYQAWHLRGVRAFHQTGFDWTRYRDWSRPRAAAVALAHALSLAREYDRGDKPLELFLGRYQHSASLDP